MNWCREGARTGANLTPVLRTCELLFPGPQLEACACVIKGPSAGAVNFVYQNDRSIRNLHPRAGEQQAYAKSRNTAESAGSIEEFALITVTAGPEKNQHILNLISAESELFWPLGLYITDPVYAKDLADHLRLPSGKLPAFEVIVKAELRGQRPIRISYVTHRVILSPP